MKAFSMWLTNALHAPGRRATQLDAVTAQSLIAAFRAFLDDIIMLKEFVDLNSTGFRKILKKVHLACNAGSRSSG
jgi:SPX domain protein involved in polyphosphate accumulation